MSIIKEKIINLAKCETESSVLRNPVLTIAETLAFLGTNENMSNQKIKSKLLSLKRGYRANIDSITNFDKLLNHLYQKLKNFDFNSYKQKLEVEIEQNLNE